MAGSMRPSRTNLNSALSVRLRETYPCAISHYLSLSDAWRSWLYQLRKTWLRLRSSRSVSRTIGPSWTSMRRVPLRASLCLMKLSLMSRKSTRRANRLESVEYTFRGLCSWDCSTAAQIASNVLRSSTSLLRSNWLRAWQGMMLSSSHTFPLCSTYASIWWFVCILFTGIKRQSRTSLRKICANIPLKTTMSTSRLRRSFSKSGWTICSKRRIVFKRSKSKMLFQNDSTTYWGLMIFAKLPFLPCLMLSRPSKRLILRSTTGSL